MEQPPSHSINAALLNSQSPAVLTGDEALQKAGDSHRYQIRTTIIFALQWTIMAFILQGQPFLFLAPKFVCKDSSGNSYQCEEKEACKNDIRQVDPDSPNSLTVQFDVYCEREYLKALCQTLFFVFSNISTLIFSFLSDLKGRRWTILLLYIIGAIPLLIAGFATSWTMFMCFLIFSGIGINPYSALCFVLLSESAGEKYRQLSSVGLLMTWGLGQLLFIPIAYYFPNWQTLLLYWIAIPLIAQIITYFWIYESPKFLIMKRRFTDARKVLDKIADVNGRKNSNFQFREELQAQAQIENDRMNDTNTSKQRIYTYLDLFRYKSQFRITLILCLAYFSLYLTYYGGIFALESLGGNIYITAIIVNCAELIAYIASSPVVRYLPRRFAFPFCFLALGVSCIIFLAVESYAVVLTLAVITKFATAIGFSVCYVYTSELYPTTVRSLGIGLVTFIGKFGCAVAPIFISVFQYTIGVHPMVSFGIFGLAAGIATIFLNETLKKPLLDEIPEVTEKNLDNKFFKEPESTEEDRGDEMPSEKKTFLP